MKSPLSHANQAQEAIFVVAAGDIMALDSVIVPFVILVEEYEGIISDPTYGARVYFRWLAHPDATNITKRDWIWEKSLRDAAWLKVT